jgi:hypothetical protein
MMQQQNKNNDVFDQRHRMTKLHTPAGDIKFTPLMKLIYSYIWTFQGNEKQEMMIRFIPILTSSPGKWEFPKGR